MVEGSSPLTIGPVKKLIVVMMIVAACSGGIAEDATGEKIYVSICSRCHARDLSGGIGPALGKGTNAAEQPDEFLRLTIQRGKGRMPSFDRTLTEEQVGRLVEYIRQRQRE